jgi:hypothetical protein
MPVLAGVDEKRLAVRHDEQRRVGLLHIDLVDAQGLRSDGTSGKDDADDEGDADATHRGLPAQTNVAGLATERLPV